MMVSGPVSQAVVCTPPAATGSGIPAIVTEEPLSSAALDAAIDRPPA
jgi:hypothetical protein